MNVYLNLEVRKLNLKLSFINNWELAKLGFILFLDLDNFIQKST